MRVISKTQCSACQKYFVGVSAFDAHRIGDYGKRERRCLTDAEMIEVGFDSERLLVKFRLDNKPMKEEQQVWFQVAKRESLRKAYDRSADEEDED